MNPDPLCVRDALIDTFQSQIGVKETAPNSGPQVDQYLASVGLSPGYPWCGAFVAWGYKNHGLYVPKGAAFTPSWFVAGKLIPLREVKRGDVGGIYFASLGRIAHIVVFEQDDEPGKNLILTIEGNTNDSGSRTGHSVLRKRRSKNQIYRCANWID